MPTERSESVHDEGGSHSKKSRLFPKRSKPKHDHELERKKQVQDYIAWVNNYLKKRPHAPLVTDLRCGMQDGITLINLVEIAANSEIPFVDRNPLSASARRSNIEKAIAFLNSDGANLGSDSTKDIIDGSMKGVMRVVLAIAEKYNPRSVRPIPGSNRGVPPHQSYSQDHSTNRSHSPDRLRPDHPPRASSPLANYMSQQGTMGVALSQGYTPPHHQSFIGGSLSQGGPIGGIGGPGGGSFSLSQPTQADGIYSTPIDSLPQHITQHITNHMPRHRVIGPRPSRPLGVGAGGNTKPNGTVGLTNKPPPPLPPKATDEENKDPKIQIIEEKETLSTDVHNEIGGVLNQLSEFKTELLQLHAVLLDNISGGDSDQETSDITNIKLPLEVANSQIAEKDKEIEQLCNKLKKLEEQSKKVDTECETLRGMVMERNQFITSMKSEIYRKEYRNDTEKVDLQTQLLHKDKTVKMLEGELSLLKASMEGKEREVTELRENVRQYETMEVELREELEHITAQLTHVKSSEESLQMKLSSRDRKILSLEEKLDEGRKFDTSIVSDEMDSIRRKIESLKSTLDQQPQQSMLESLEKSISDLYTKLTTDGSRSYSPGRKPRRHAYHEERREEKRRRHKERSTKDEVYHTVGNPVEWTKVFYYMTGDKTETPYVTTVPRKSHEVRLKDFKAVFDRQGSYRFYFKTEDPDCGIVREEIISEEQILPDWNGKIMVWVSEKAHHR